MEKKKKNSNISDFLCMLKLLLTIGQEQNHVLCLSGNSLSTTFLKILRE